MMKAHPYSFLTLILITLAFLFSAQALAEDIDAKLSDTSDASSFQVKNSSDSVLMKVQSGGNVGIGTTSPTARIHIKGSGTNKAKVRIEGITGDHPSVNFLDSATQKGVVGWYRTGDAIKLLYSETLASPNGITIKSNGNTGIGTGTPAEELDVNGNVEISGEAGKLVFPASHYDVKIELFKGGDEKIGTSDNQLKLIAGSGTTDNIAFFGDSTEVMRLGTGIGTAAPNLTLQVNGSIATKYYNATSDYTVKNEAIIGVNTASAVTITLPAPADSTGRIITIKNETNNGNEITITPASGSIDGSSSYSTTDSYGFLQVYSSGNNWFIIARSYAY